MELNLTLPKITIESKCIKKHRSNRPLCKKYGCRGRRMPNSYGCCSAHHVAIIVEACQVVKR